VADEGSRVLHIPLNSVVGVSIAAGVISFYAGASLVSALLISPLLIMQCALGHLLVVRVFQCSMPSELSSIALWSVVGTAVTTSLDQALCTFAGHADHFVYLAIVITGAVASVLAAWKCQILRQESGTPPRTTCDLSCGEPASIAQASLGSAASDSLLCLDVHSWF